MNELPKGEIPAPEEKPQLDELIEQLQVEADRLFPESTHGERDIWLNLQLVRAALQSGDPERANDAIQDAITLAVNYERGDIVAELQTLLLE